MENSHDQHLHNDVQKRDDRHHKNDPSQNGQQSDGQQPIHRAFFSSMTYSTLIVQKWTTATSGGLLGGVLAGVILSLLLEGVKLFNFTNKLFILLSKCPSAKMPVSQRLLTSVMHMLEVSTGYLLMLLVMSFNIFIIIAVIVGAGLGHFIIRPIVLRKVNKILAKGRKHQMRNITPPKHTSHRDSGNSGMEDSGNRFKLEGQRLPGIDNNAEVFLEHCCVMPFEDGVQRTAEEERRKPAHLVDGEMEDSSDHDDCEVHNSSLHCRQCVLVDGKETPL